MLVQQASLTTTSMIGPEMMEKLIVKRFNTAVAQHFPPSTLQQPEMR